MKKQKSDSIQDKFIEISLKSFPIMRGRQKTLLCWDCLRDNLPETSWWPIISCEFLEELLIKDFLRSERVEIALKRRQGEVLMQLGHACTTSTALLAAQDLYILDLLLIEKLDSLDNPAAVVYYNCSFLNINQFENSFISNLVCVRGAREEPGHCFISCLRLLW